MLLRTRNVPGLARDDIQPFIFNWRNQFATTCEIERALIAIFGGVTVINSDDHHTRPGWIDLGEDAYFSDQFRKALQLFDGRVLMHVQGDTSYPDWAGVVESARRYFALYEWGIFVPNVDYTWYSAEHADVDAIELGEANLKLCACSDETVWMVHRDVIDEFHRMDLLRCFEHNKLGWGWDLVLCALSFLMQRPVLRDYAHTIAHPRGRGYDREAALLEMATLTSRLPQPVVECISYIKGDRDNLARYFPSG